MLTTLLSVENAVQNCLCVLPSHTGALGKDASVPPFLVVPRASLVISIPR